MQLTQRHQITRIRRDVRRRILTLASIDRLSPSMLRLGFASSDLADFISSAPDDHIKLFFPSADAPDSPPQMRDYTPRSFDTAQGTLVIDFAIHDAGPATSWALAARIGDTLEIGGPRGSAIVPDDYDWYLLIGDETALPAIGRRVEELRAGVPVTTFVLAAPGDEQIFDTRAIWTGHWLNRTPAMKDGALICAALDDYPFPPGDGFVWIAAEAHVARHVKTYMIEQRQHNPEWIKAAGYWLHGEADTGMKVAK